MAFRLWITKWFCLGHGKHDTGIKQVHVIPVRSDESTVFHKAVMQFESLQYKPVDNKSREDSHREREITMYITRHSHGRIEAQQAAERRTWEREAQVQDMNKMWLKAKAAAQEAWEYEHEPDPEPEPEPERMTRQSRKSRLNVETHLSPRSHCHKHQPKHSHCHGQGQSYKHRHHRNSKQYANKTYVTTTQCDPLDYER